MPEGTLLRGVKREFLEVDVAYQKRDFAPWFTLLSLLVYWIKFFVDLSGGDAVMGSLDDALEAVAPFAGECALQTTDWRRLFTYQFVHVDVGHLVANSIILLVLGSPLEMAHGPVVGLAFEAGVVLGCVEIKILRRVPARWRGDAGSPPLDRARTAASSPRNDFVKNYQCARHTG